MDMDRIDKPLLNQSKNKNKRKTVMDQPDKELIATNINEGMGGSRQQYSSDESHSLSESEEEKSSSS